MDLFPLHVFLKQEMEKNGSNHWDTYNASFDKLSRVLSGTAAEITH